MSTRAIIARPNGDGFIGRHHHWDGFPTGLGKALYELHHGFFKQDLDRMLTVLLDEHPAGWSTIVDTNFRYKPRWKGPTGSKQPPKREADRHPVCYCHGDRRYEPTVFTDGDCTDHTWLYVLNARTGHMFIFIENGFDNGDYEHGRNLWRLVEDVDLNAPAPDWALLKRKGEEL